jgi:hypothetical protein
VAAFFVKEVELRGAAPKKPAEGAVGDTARSEQAMAETV